MWVLESLSCSLQVTFPGGFLWGKVIHPQFYIQLRRKITEVHRRENYNYK